MYAELARAGPVHRVTLPTGVVAWLVTGHAEARQVLTDPRVGRGPTLAGPIAEQLPPAVREATASLLLYRNPPDHTRLQRPVRGVHPRPGGAARA